MIALEGVGPEDFRATVCPTSFTYSVTWGVLVEGVLAQEARGHRPTDIVFLGIGDFPGRLGRLGGAGGRDAGSPRQQGCHGRRRRSPRPRAESPAAAQQTCAPAQMAIHGVQPSFLDKGLKFAGIHPEGFNLVPLRRISPQGVLAVGGLDLRGEALARQGRFVAGESPSPGRRRATRGDPPPLAFSGAGKPGGSPAALALILHFVPITRLLQHRHLRSLRQRGDGRAGEVRVRIEGLVGLGDLQGSPSGAPGSQQQDASPSMASHTQWFLENLSSHKTSFLPSGEINYRRQVPNTKGLALLWGTQPALLPYSILRQFPASATTCTFSPPAPSPGASRPGLDRDNRG